MLPKQGPDQRKERDEPVALNPLFVNLTELTKAMNVRRKLSILNKSATVSFQRESIANADV